MPCAFVADMTFRMKELLALAVLLCDFLVAAPLSAATYYVSQGGSDSNAGTQLQPFLTIQKGMNTAQAGDTVMVGAGTYEEDIRSARSGTSNAMITVDGQGVAQVRALILTHGFLQVKSLTIAGSTISSLIYMDRNADHCVISNNIIDAAYTPGLRLMLWNAPDTKPFGNAGSDNLVISNTFRHSKGEAGGITVFGDRNLIKGNTFRDSDTVDWLRVWGRTNTVVGNTFTNHFESGGVPGHSDFFQVFGPAYGAQGIVIEQNTIIKMGSPNAQLCMISPGNQAEIRDITFRNNLFVDVPRKANIGARDVKWHNNTFIRCASADSVVLSFYVGTNSIYTNLVANSAHGGQALNNVFLDCGPFTNFGSISGEKLGWYGFDRRLTNVVADYNFVAKNNYQPVAQDDEQIPIGDPTRWNWMAWWEPHGINGGNPGFFSISDLNFHLREGSILRNKGIPLPGLSVDLNGVTRRNPPSIGAFEYVPGFGEPAAPRALRVVP